MKVSQASPAGPRHRAPTTPPLDDLVLGEVSKIVLVVVETLQDLAPGCPAPLNAHVRALSEELAGATVAWVRRWPA